MPTSFCRYTIRLRNRAFYQRVKPFTMIAKYGRFEDNLLIAERQVRKQNLSGSYVECGVWRGGMSFAMMQILPRYGITDFHFFDSFQGLPQATDKDGEEVLSQQRNGELWFDDNNADHDQFLRDMERFKTPSVTTSVYPGWFEDTLGDFPNDGRIAVLRLDCDWYDSIRICFDTLWERVIPGGLVLIDDYYDWSGCSNAVHEFLTEQFAADRPYNEIVTELIASEGLWTDRPSVNFVTATFDSGNDKPDPVRLAAKTSRVFLGLRIDCLQCHDDFLGNVSLGDPVDTREGTQADFHQLAAFFTAAKGNGIKGIISGKAEYKYKYLDASEEVEVQPAVPFSQQLLPESGNARQRLAGWITHRENKQAARAAVSHVWALMFGRPIGEAVDDLPLDEEVSPMLNVLAEDFAENGFKLRRLIRLIVASDAFQVASQSDGIEITPKHERVYAAFPLVRLRPEQVAGAAVQAARIKTVDRDSALLVQLQKFGSVNDFIKRYGDMGADEFSDDPVTITQRLVMINGKMIDEHTDANPVLHAGTHIRMFSPDDSSLVDNVYLSILNRYPSDDVRAHFLARLADAGNKDKAVEDLYWVLLNSSEFAWNH